MRPSRAPLLAVTSITIGALALSGCSTTASNDNSGTAVAVLASFYPLQYVTEQVGGDLVSVDDLTPPGAEPHDLELSPAQVASLGQADLVVYLSEFQAAVDEAVGANPPVRVIDAADVVTLHPAEHDHADGDEEGDSHGSLDPHFWLNPTLLPAVADSIAAVLSEIDPDHADDYATGAAAFTTRMNDLDQKYSTGLATCESRTIITTHAAFGYLADQYDLTEVGVSGVDPEAEPSPARLREISALIQAEGVTTIFLETLASPKVADTLASEAGVQTAVLDPLEGLADDTQDYESIANANLTALQTALSCS